MDDEGRPIGPDVSYEPTPPKQIEATIALVGCGGIGNGHASAFSSAGYDIVAFCDVDEGRARELRDEYYPESDVYTDYRAIVARDDVDVIDFAVHPEIRESMFEDAIEAGKHVFSEKPFVVDLDVGERLVDLAEQRGVKLAVNQNRRWNPWNSYVRNLVAGGFIGDPITVNLSVRRDKDPLADIKEENEYWLLYNFGVHSFDAVVDLMAGSPQRVYASTTRSSSQESESPLLGQVAVDYDDAQATIRFDCDTRHGAEDVEHVIGSEGTVSARAGGGEFDVAITTAGGVFHPDINRFSNHYGSMTEFLCAIEEDREPDHSGRNNLETLELAFAAVASADEGEPKKPGEVRRLPDNTIRDFLRVE